MLAYRALVAVDELNLQLVVREVDVRARDALSLVVLLLPLDQGVGEVGLEAFVGEVDAQLLEGVVPGQG